MHPDSKKELHKEGSDELFLRCQSVEEEQMGSSDQFSEWHHKCIWTFNKSGTITICF